MVFGVEFVVHLQDEIELVLFLHFVNNIESDLPRVLLFLLLGCERGHLF